MRFPGVLLVFFGPPLGIVDRIRVDEEEQVRHFKTRPDPREDEPGMGKVTEPSKTTTRSCGRLQPAQSTWID
jgi:hypothetical protein